MLFHQLTDTTLISIALVFLLCCAIVTFDVAPTSLRYAAATLPTPTSTDEFDGPFSSWTNVQTACGATGNGSTDDTTAIQNCLSSLPSSTTLYFPTGTYKITSGLRIPTGSGDYVVGADPTTTTIKWAGDSGATVLTMNGNYGAIGRLTIDGSSRAGIDLETVSTGNVTSNLYYDMYFENAGIGLQLGTSNAAVSEQTCLRCRFLNNTTEGLYTYGSNTVNIWIWDSYFSGNAVGATQGGWGEFSIYRSTFVNQTTADVKVGSTNALNSFRYNVSFGSPAFFIESGNASETANIVFMDNRLLDTGSTPITDNFSGPTTILDNIIRSPSGSSSVAISVAGGANAPVVTSMGNQFTTTASSPISVSGNAPNRLYEQNDSTVAYDSVSTAVPTPVPPPPNNSRTVCEVASGSGSSTIQSCVNNAVAGTRTVVHLAAGSHTISSTINIPGGLDVQFIGDGWNSNQTNLSWSGGSAGPIFKCNSPCKAWFRDFYIRGGGAAVNAFDIYSDDSATSRVQIGEAYSDSIAMNCLETDNLTNTLVNAYSWTCERGGSAANNIVVNGMGGSSIASRVLFVGGTGGPSSSGAEYVANGNGNLVGWDMWDEIQRPTLTWSTSLASRRTLLFQLACGLRTRHMAQPVSPSTTSQASFCSMVRTSRPMGRAALVVG